MQKIIRTLTMSIALIAFFQLTLPVGALAQETYAHSQEKWRKDQEKDLTTPNGWLTLTGLFWLKEGKNFLGSAPQNDLVFPGAGVPPSIGVIEFRDSVAWFTADPSVPVTADGKVVRSTKLNPDATPPPTILHLGTLSWNVIKRGGRYGIRLRDSASPRLTGFTGMKWYPAHVIYRVEAKFTAYDQPKDIPITDAVGDTYTMPSPGLLTFTIGGQQFTLQPLTEDDHLWIIFRDLTSGKTTYGAGRFLYAPLPKDGKVTLDFNQAVNPPCAFTPFATCPLPPAKNWLKIAIPAGEMKYHADDAEGAKS